MDMHEKVRDGVEDPLDYLPILVFTAFTIEAYVNSIGYRKIADWDVHEGKRWKEKIDILHGNVGAVAKWGSNPLQFACKLFDIRDRVAHGKPEIVSGPLCIDTHTASCILVTQHLKPTIYNNLTKDWVLKSGDHLYKLLEHLGSLYQLRAEDFTYFSTSYTETHYD